MTIQVTGVLSTPTDEPVDNADIRIRSVENAGSLYKTESVKTTDSLGNYTFSLLNGKYRIDLRQSGKYISTAYVEVTTSTTTPITLDTLIKDYGFCKPIAPVCP